MKVMKFNNTMSFSDAVLEAIANMKQVHPICTLNVFLLDGKLARKKWDPTSFY